MRLTSSKAASIAACNSLTGRSAATSISTMVPSRGRARRIRPGAVLAARDSDCIGRKKAADTVSHVLAGKSCAADVLNVASNLDGIAVLTARELGAPAGIAHLAAISLPIFEDLG